MPHPVEPVIVTDEIGRPVVLNPAESYEQSSWMVKRYPWAFQSDDIETVTAAPGEKRRGPGRPRTV